MTQPYDDPGFDQARAAAGPPAPASLARPFRRPPDTATDRLGPR